MKSLARILSGTVLILSFSTAKVHAQGPAGAGASVAAEGGSSSSRSLNPLKLFGKKKEAKPSADANAPAANDALDKRLEAKLHEQHVLEQGVTLKDSCVKFLQRFDCLAALHASHSLGLDFECVKSNVTGVRVGGDTSSCRMPDGDKPLSLAKTIKLLKPEANAKSAAKDAENLAKEELRQAGA